MFGFLDSIGMKISFGVIIALVAVMGTGYWYFTSEIKSLRIEQDNLKGEITMLKVENSGLKAEKEMKGKTEQLVSGINSKLQKLETQGHVLEDLYSEHDLERLAAKKPGLIERRVNSAVSNIFKDIEELSKPESYSREPVPPTDKKEEKKEGKKNEPN